MKPIAFVILLLTVATTAAGDEWTAEQREVVAALDRLSASTRPGGDGVDACAEMLAPDYSHWTVGRSAITGRNAWIEAVREWWNDGWRVVDSSADLLEITIRGDFATTRRVVRESYRGPQGEETDSHTALAETWVRHDGEWRLLRVNAHAMTD
jgi:hypothetical protein